MGQKHLCVFIHVHNAHEVVDGKKINKMIKLYLRGEGVERAVGLQRNEARLWFLIVVKVKYVFWKGKEIDSNSKNWSFSWYNWYTGNLFLSRVHYDLNWHWDVVFKNECTFKSNFTVMRRISCWGMKANWMQFCYYYTIIVYSFKKYWVPTQCPPSTYSLTYK